MEIGKPFIIESPAEGFENHIYDAAETSGNIGKAAEAGQPLPFEYSRTRMWNESFYSPEIGSGHSIAALKEDLTEIKELIRDIKDILKETFEL